MLLKTRPAPKISEARKSGPETGKAVQEGGLALGVHHSRTPSLCGGCTAEWTKVAVGAGAAVTHQRLRQAMRVPLPASRRSTIGRPRETSGLVSAPPKDGERRTGQIDRRRKDEP